MDESHTKHDKKNEKTFDPEQKSEENVQILKTIQVVMSPDKVEAIVDGAVYEEAAAGTSANNQKNETNEGDSVCAVPPVVFRLSSNMKNRNYRTNVINLEDDSGDQDDVMVEAQPNLPVENENVAMEPDEEENDDDWEDYNEDEEESTEGDSSADETHLFSESSEFSVTMEVNDCNIEEHPLLKKEKPVHWWSAVNELEKRQIGYSCKLPSRDIFQRRCYGSLHCVKRLELMYKMEEHAGCVNSLNFHPDGSVLASGADDLNIVVWDWKLGKSLLKYKTKHKGNVFQSKFLYLSGDLHIASCARDGQVRLAQLSKEEGIRNARLLGSHKGPCHKLIVLRDQPHIILSAGEDGTVYNHDVRSPKSTKVITVKEDSKNIALYSIHGHPLKSDEFCVSGRDSFVRIYDQRKSNKPTATFTPFSPITRPKDKNYVKNSHVTCAVYNCNGSEVLASYSEADIYLFNTKEIEQGKFIHKYEGHRNRATIKGVNFFGPNSEFIVSGSDCGNIYFWERNTEALVQWFPGDDSGVVNCLEPHPQLPFICTSGLDWDVKVWVPSCEQDPIMEGLKECLKTNSKQRHGHTDPSDVNESQMLWMLWRHLRNTRRLRASLNVPNALNYSDSNSSDSNVRSDSDESGDDFDRAPSCNTS